MKKIVVILCMILSLPIQAQTNKVFEQRVDSLIARIDTLVQLNNMWLEQIELNHSLKN